MTINEIMLRDIEAARRDANRDWQDRRLSQIAARRELIAKTVSVIVWASVIILGLVAAFVAGYRKCGKDDITRHSLQQKEWAEQKLQSETQARAMSNWELIQSCEKIAAKNKTGETH